MLAISETSAPSVISQSEMPPFSGENGNPFVATRHFPYQGNFPKQSVGGGFKSSAFVSLLILHFQLSIFNYKKAVIDRLFCSYLYLLPPL